MSLAGPANDGSADTRLNLRWQPARRSAAPGFRDWWMLVGLDTGVPDDLSPSCNFPLQMRGELVGCPAERVHALARELLAHVRRAQRFINGAVQLRHDVRGQ